MSVKSYHLITEAKNFDLNVIKPIVENTDKEKNYYIEGIFIQCDTKNRNGRNYGKALMENCVKKYVSERMNPNDGFRSFGELGHPEGPEINLDKVCHYVQSFRWDGPNCIGKAKVLSSHPSGRILQTFLEEKLRVGVSTRGLGSLSESENLDGSKEVESYEMIAVDAVADPSAPRGFVEGILENKEYIIQDNGVIYECVNKLKRQVNTLPKDSELKSKIFLEAFKRFMNDLKNC